MNTKPEAALCGPKRALRRGGAFFLKALAGSFVGVLIFVGSSHAIALTFTPKGAQLDADPILDIQTAPGANITFDVFFNTLGAAKNINALRYTVNWDPQELRLAGRKLDVPNVWQQDKFALQPGGSANVTHTVGPVAAGVAPFLLDSFTFLVLPGLVNDGKKDFFFTDARVAPAAAGPVVHSQIVEVQPKTEQPVPEPASALLLGMGLAGAALAKSRWKGGAFS